MIGKYQQSVYDYVSVLVPHMLTPPNNHVDVSAAHTLYEIWRDEKNKLGDKTLKIPVTLSSDVVNRMENAGLIRSSGRQLELTRRGSDVLKVMILGNDRSIFERDEINDFHSSLAATKPGLLTARGKKTLTASSRKHENSWWERFT